MQMQSVEMGVYLGRYNAFMPHHIFHGNQIGTSFYQFCGETVSQSVRMYVFLYPCGKGSVFYHLKSMLPRQLPAVMVQKNQIFVFVVDFQLASVIVDEVTQVFQCTLSYRNETFLVAFAENLDIFLFPKDCTDRSLPRPR